MSLFFLGAKHQRISALELDRKTEEYLQPNNSCTRNIYERSDRSSFLKAG